MMLGIVVGIVGIIVTVISIVAVSYTHLDVYKRQGIRDLFRGMTTLTLPCQGRILSAF